MNIELASAIALVFSHIFMIFYFIWVLVPDRVLHSLGIYYYPSKHWAVALPALAVFCWPVFGLHQFLCDRSNLYPMDSPFCFADSYPQSWDNPPKGEPIYDIPLDEVNKKLYLD